MGNLPAEIEYPLLQWRSQPDIWSCRCKFFCVYRPYKESISKEINNDLNLHSMTKLLGWFCSCTIVELESTADSESGILLDSFTGD